MFSNVSLRCLTLPSTERFSKALLQLKSDIAYLKLVSTIFYQIYILHQTVALQKL